MADVVALRAALARLGFSAASCTFITDSQGLDSLDELKLLTDSEIESLCKVVRRPGGTMANPAAGAAGQPALIPNPGLPVQLRAELNLKLACYFLRYKDRTSRDVLAADITLPNVREFRNHREWEDDHKDVDAPELNSRDWPRTIEGIEEWLRGCLGVTKTPLAYVIRATELMPAVDPAGGYDSKQDELIARAPIRVANDPNGDFTTDDRLHCRPFKGLGITVGFDSRARLLVVRTTCSANARW